jgi:ribosomal protein L11 methyltransferase
MAFGTGSHPTTRGCMEFIERIADSFDDGRVAALDVGTGSGILAIALAKLGIEKITAIDTDPVAVKVARENVRCNHVHQQIVVSHARLGDVRRSFHVIVANLTAETILELAAPLARRVRPFGYLILSGILKPRDQDVSRYFCSTGFRLIGRKPDKEWVTLLLRQS